MSGRDVTSSRHNRGRRGGSRQEPCSSPRPPPSYPTDEVFVPIPLDGYTPSRVDVGVSGGVTRGKCPYETTSLVVTSFKRGLSIRNTVTFEKRFGVEETLTLTVHVGAPRIFQRIPPPIRMGR